jgi:hypothetical protein
MKQQTEGKDERPVIDLLHLISVLINKNEREGANHGNSAESEIGV